MRRILAICLTFHWMVVFALLSFSTIRGIGQGKVPVLDMLGVEFLGDAVPFGGRSIPALLAVMMSLVAALFLWALLSVATDKSEDGAAAEDATRIAFAASIGLMTFGLAVFAFIPLGGHILSAAVFCGALVASYIAIVTERLVAPEPLTATPVSTDIARLMARDAGRIAGLRRPGIVYPFPERDR